MSRGNSVVVLTAKQIDDISDNGNPFVYRADVDEKCTFFNLMKRVCLCV